jgi:hypothetical protein
MSYLTEDMGQNLIQQQGQKFVEVMRAKNRGTATS